MRIWRCELTLLEATFFVSREVSDFYQTEAFIGNYALAYALGWVAAPYFNDGTVHYQKDLSELNRKGFYVTPATLVGEPRFVVEQFNAQPDAYWYAMGQNVLVTRPDGWDVVKQGTRWRLINRRTGESHFAPVMNRPQIGRIKMLALGTRAIFYVLAQDATPRLPSYIRLGKWMSKARVGAQPMAFKVVEAENVTVPILLNPVDLPEEMFPKLYDVLTVHPVPLIRNALLSGRFYRLADGVHLPVGMRFGVEKLA